MIRQPRLQIFAMFSLVVALGYTLDRGNSYGDDAVAPPASSADQTGTHTSELDGTEGRRFRLREGMKLVNQIGELKEAGGRIVFYPDGQAESLQLLENLALERVSDEVNQTHRKWSVTGIVTEYRGGNYLLLHRAVLKARESNLSSPRS